MKHIALCLIAALALFAFAGCKSTKKDGAVTCPPDVCAPCQPRQ